MIRDKNTNIIISEAKKLGLRVKVLQKKRRFLELSIGRRKFLLQRDFRINIDRFGTRNIPLFKDLTYLLWKREKIPIPKTAVAFSLEEAKERLKGISSPWVIKDARGSLSKYVWVDVLKKEEAISILKKLFFPLRIKAVIIQKFVQGREFRILVLKDKILGIVELIWPSITGDGCSSVKKLIRGLEKKVKCEITIDKDLKNLIKYQGYSSTSVLPKNRKIYLREYSSLRQGGKIRSIPVLLHPQIKQLCFRAARSVGLELGGLDIIAEDLLKPPQNQKLKFIEINGRPDLWIHHLPDEGKPVNVTRKILKYIFFKGFGLKNDNKKFRNS